MIAFHPISTELARAYQAGGPDACGMVPERRVSAGDGVPCRHCLQMVPAGAPGLVLAHRPFPALQPYGETGPVFLCAGPCGAAVPVAEVPAMLDPPTCILRGYGADNRIVYGTGRVMATGDLLAAAMALLARPELDHAHVRSAANNCFQVAVHRSRAAAPGIFCEQSDKVPFANGGNWSIAGRIPAACSTAKDRRCRLPRQKPKLFSPAALPATEAKVPWGIPGSG